MQINYLSGVGRRNIEGGFVRLQGDDGIIELHSVTGATRISVTSTSSSPQAPQVSQHSGMSGSRISNRSLIAIRLA